MLVAAWALVVFVAMTGLGVDVQTDITTLTLQDNASNGPVVPELSRDVLVALSDADSNQIGKIASKFAVTLRKDPRVANVSLGPEAPSEDFMTWIWDNRFSISPPAADAFKRPQMIARLETSKAAFSSVESMGLGDRLLLDPTGSFESVISKLSLAENALLVRDGVWSSNNGQSAIVFVTLADRKFEARNVNSLATDMRALAQDHGVTALVVGAQVIAAQTTLANTRASTLASLVATALLFGWLIWCLRSRAVIAVFVPLAIGIATAVVVVQAVFGSVHVVTLGFGGALLGLALDYPVHLIGHTGAARPRALRLIVLGAATTSVSFLAMLGSGIPALEQIGLFVPSGLLAAAGVAIVLPTYSAQTIRIFSLSRFAWRLPRKPLIEIALMVSGLAFAIIFNGPASLNLFEPPSLVKADIKGLGQIIDLPSGRHAVLVRGNDLNDLLKNEEQLAPVLDHAISEGQLIAYGMLQQTINPNARALPTLLAFRTAAHEALAGAGMNVDFAHAQTEAYGQALAAPPIRYQDLLSFPETRGLAMRVKKTAEGWQETVQLFLPKEVVQPEFLISSETAELVDLLAPVQRSLYIIQNQMIRWLSIGFGVGAVLLMLGLRSLRAAWAIVRTTSASVAVTAAILVALFGGLSIFHLVALALVAGIGVDYSVFYRETSIVSEERAAGRSIALCASSTLMTFVVLCFSNVLILQQIGITVIIGLTLMLALTLANNGDHQKYDARI